MATLTEPQKREIVTALAMFSRPVEVADMMKELHDLELTPSQIVRYDASCQSWEANEDLRALFDVTRKAFLEDVQTVPIANQGYRLRILQDTLNKAIKGKNLVLANATLEQAAKEVGGVLTNDRNLKIDRGNGSAMSELTPEERRGLVADMLREALDSKKQQNAPAPETPQ